MSGRFFMPKKGLELDGLNGNGQEIFLEMVLQKGSVGLNKDGNIVFEVEASNENLDLESQRVLQRALLDSKDYFLSNGVVSDDHKHRKIGPDGEIDYDRVIGEPIEVYTKGNRTFVKGILYAAKEHAKKFIDLLKSHSTRVKASIGGRAPRVRTKIEKGVNVGTVVSVLWDDIALTITPVNSTVAPAILSKSMTSLEFVKSLAAGHGTDHAGFTGGRALQTQGDTSIDEAMKRLIEALSDGVVTSMEEAEDYLKEFGLSNTVSQDVIGEIVNNHKEFKEVLPMAKGKLFSDIIENLKKSMGGGNAKKPDDQDPDELNRQTAAGADDGNDDDYDDEEVEVTEVIKALADKLEEVVEGQDALLKALNKLAEQGTQDVEFKKSTVEALEAIAGAPSPKKGITSAVEAALMAKGGLLNQPKPGERKHKQFTAETRNKATEILTKAVAAGELDFWDSMKIETQINKSLRDPNFQLDQKYQEFLAQKFSA
jgi:uncharacterized protein YjgD (DUF1641 family)